MATMDEIIELPDGTYIQDSYGDIEEYASKWAYGYIVGTAPIMSDQLDGLKLFGVWTDDDGVRYYDHVVHVDAYQDAISLAMDYGQEAIYGLREEEVIYV